MTEVIPLLDFDFDPDPDFDFASLDRQVPRMVAVTLNVIAMAETGLW